MANNGIICDSKQQLTDVRPTTLYVCIWTKNKKKIEEEKEDKTRKVDEKENMWRVNGMIIRIEQKLRRHRAQKSSAGEQWELDRK